MHAIPSRLDSYVNGLEALRLIREIRKSPQAKKAAARAMLKLRAHNLRKSKPVIERLEWLASQDCGVIWSFGNVPVCPPGIVRDLRSALKLDTGLDYLKPKRDVVLREAADALLKRAQGALEEMDALLPACESVESAGG